MRESDILDRVTGERWFGSKTRTVAGAAVVDRALLAEGLELELVEIRFDTGTHETYQLLSEGGDLRGLARLIRAGERIPAENGLVEAGVVPEVAGSGDVREARVSSAEQSNTSVVFDDELILKVFRRLEPGVNPELELLRFLTERGFENIAPLAGWYAYAGRQMSATLGIMQRYVADGRDGWEITLDAIADGDEGWFDAIRRLGEVTGKMHAVLGSDLDDPGFAPEPTSVESLGLLTATIDEEIASIFACLPAEVEELEPIRGRGEEVRERLRLLTSLGGTGRVIRPHGDFHLGQALWTGEDWVILDFEGEPARSLLERRRKRSPLRDVAGMLRSFAYAASAAAIKRGVEPPPDWEARAREEFLQGYRDTVEQSLVPPGASQDKLLQLFELEKAVYELRYELDTRPDWVGIPVAGIVRLLEQEVPV